MADLTTFVVIYRYVPDMEHRRAPHRDEHLRWIHELAEQGRMLLAGAVQDPVDSAILVMRATDLHETRRLLIDDPYAKANLITEVVARPIGLAIGGSGEGPRPR
ncbi:MAG: hypothetical protein QG622_930 [Actinomycetota bacterium]|nr:hypothetical protein [Actinomycetota bacterium]